MDKTSHQYRQYRIHFEFHSRWISDILVLLVGAVVVRSSIEKCCIGIYWDCVIGFGTFLSQGNCWWASCCRGHTTPIIMRWFQVRMAFEHLTPINQLHSWTSHWLEIRGNHRILLYDLRSLCHYFLRCTPCTRDLDGAFDFFLTFPLERFDFVVMMYVCWCSLSYKCFKNLFSCMVMGITIDTNWLSSNYLGLSYEGGTTVCYVHTNSEWLMNWSRNWVRWIGFRYDVKCWLPEKVPWLKDQ
jgi:hypothetical protein